MARETQGQTGKHQRLARVYGGEYAREQATRISEGRPLFGCRLDLFGAAEKRHGRARSTLTQAD